MHNLLVEHHSQAVETAVVVAEVAAEAHIAEAGIAAAEVDTVAAAGADTIVLAVFLDRSYRTVAVAVVGTAVSAVFLDHSYHTAAAVVLAASSKQHCHHLAPVAVPTRDDGYLREQV